MVQRSQLHTTTLNTIAHTSRVNPFPSKPFLFLSFRSPGSVVNFETVYHVLEANGPRVLDVQVA
jgi:hypothetical protein